ncbi:MAG: pyridoxamine 5'-phosphate oxidase family protein [Candidatus Peribacteraceae bacterium]|nr:pyridoxamine 5'-phosphate oxidase family protein [Candidatus Peribacteraceae bacterium]
MQGILLEEEIDELLASARFGHLGCADGDRPYVVPMAYVFRDGHLYGQTTTGQKVEMLRRNPSVCFQVESREDGRWRSVICWGRFEELAFDELVQSEAVEIVRLLSERLGGIQKEVGVDVPFAFGQDAVPLKVNDKESTLFRIVVTEKTGRFFGA